MIFLSLNCHILFNLNSKHAVRLAANDNVMAGGFMQTRKQRERPLFCLLPKASHNLKRAHLQNSFSPPRLAEAPKIDSVQTVASPLLVPRLIGADEEESE